MMVNYGTNCVPLQTIIIANYQWLLMHLVEGKQIICHHSTEYSCYETRRVRRWAVEKARREKARKQTYPYELLNFVN